MYRILILFIALAGTSHFLASNMMKQANNGFSEPKCSTVANLEKERIGENAFVDLRTAYPGKPVFTYGVDENTIVPLFANRLESRRAERLLVFVRFPRLFSAPQMDRLIEEIKAGEYEIAGIAQTGLAAEQVEAIAEVYPESKIAQDCLIVKHGTTPNRQAFYGMVGLHALGLLLNFFGMLWFFRSARFPKQLGHKILCLFIGVSMSGIGIWICANQTFDYKIQKDLLLATSYALLVSTGLAITLATLVSFGLSQVLFRTNLLGETTIQTNRHLLRLSKGNQTEEIPFDQILAISLNCDNERVSRSPTKFELQIAMLDDSTKVTGVLEPGEAKELQQQLNPLFEYLKDHLIEQIMSGEPVGTNDWTIDGDQLLIRESKRNVLELPLNQVSAIERVGNNLAVWMNSDFERAAQIPTSALNAHVLQKIVQHFIELTGSDIQNTTTTDSETEVTETTTAEFGNLSSSRFLTDKVKAETEQAKQHSLGRVLEEESRSNLNMVAVLIMVSFASVAIGFFVSLWAAIAVAGIGITMAIVGQVGEGSGQVLFRIHENGISLLQKNKATEILYSQFETLTYKAIKVYANGQYVGDHVQIEACKLGEEDRFESINFKSTLNSECLETIREKASREIASKMSQVLDLESRVEWIPGCFIHTDGIEVPIKAGLSKRQEKVSWDRIRQCRMENNFFLFKVDQTENWNVKLDSSLENFYPGYHLLQQILTSRQSTATQASPRTEVQHATNH